MAICDHLCFVAFVFNVLLLIIVILNISSIMFHKVDGEREKCNISHSLSCGIAKNVLLLLFLKLKGEY